MAKSNVLSAHRACFCVTSLLMSYLIPTHAFLGVLKHMETQCCSTARPARAAQGYNDGLSSESAAASEPRPQLSQEAAAAASFDKAELAPVTNQLLQEARPVTQRFQCRSSHFLV